MTAPQVREAVGVFHDFPALRAAADELMWNGFDRADLSLLADEETIVRERGQPCGSVRDAEDDDDIPYRAYVGIDSRVEGEAALIGGTIYVGTVLAAGIAAANGVSDWVLFFWVSLAGAFAALTGAVVVGVLEDRHGRYLKDQLARGGLLLWVRLRDPDHERRAVAILSRHAAEDVHVHELRHRPVEQAKEGISRQMTWLYKPLGEILHRH